MSNETTTDPFVGQGGSYVVDPASGKKELVERTAPAPTAQEILDAEAEAAAAAKSSSGSRRRSTASTDETTQS